MTMKPTAFKVLLLLYVLIASTIYALGDPSGASITYNSTQTALPASPASRTDEGGTITTMILDVIQQNQQWKAYVGNITGALTLDDALGRTIFQWSLAASSITGEIYSSRSNSISWNLINCTNATVIGAEESALGISGIAADSISNTFNETTHPTIITAGRTIAANTCNATSTFVNETRQSQSGAYFPLILFDDETNLVYVTPINQDIIGYDNTSTFDFQMIVADNPTVISTTYYFYAELG